jgi:hypothetical protein
MTVGEWAIVAICGAFGFGIINHMINTARSERSDRNKPDEPDNR